ncbi:MAG: PqqD family protein [Rikenellaceae bacterium]|jgi:hypothetical protein|nr:PqqD family protein [Rikenellaceae bacterium]
MKIDGRHKIRTVAGESIIIMQGQTTVDMTHVVSLNATSVWLFERLAGRDFDAAGVASLLVEEYGIERERAEADAAAWIEKLRSCGIIVE